MILTIKELWQKPHRAPTEPYKRRCRSKVRRQPEKTKAAGPDGRQAEAKLAKEMLRYLDNTEKVKVGIAELQERLEVPVQISIYIQQVAQQARGENGSKIFEVFWKEEEEEVYVASWAGCAVEGSVELERRCQDMNELWKYQSEKEEAKRLQGPGNRERMRKWVGHHQETCRTGLTQKRREVWKKASGGWSQKGKRKCRKSLSCRMRWKALSWTWMAKAAVSRKEQNSQQERERSTRRRESEESKSLKTKLTRVESEETQDHVSEAKSTEQEVRGKKRSAKTFVSL